VNNFLLLTSLLLILASVIDASFVVVLLMVFLNDFLLMHNVTVICSACLCVRVNCVVDSFCKVDILCVFVLSCDY